MKRRNRANRRRAWASRPTLQNLFARNNAPKRKSLSIEPLEPRMVFSASPIQLDTTSYSNATAEGAVATILRELQWAAMQSAAANPGADLTTYSLPTDPYFPNPSDPTQPSQWHLLNIGQFVGDPQFQDLVGVPGEDINVVPAWNLGVTGNGILIAVIDSGVQTNHPDLIGNIHPLFRFNALNGTNDADPEDLTIPSHGTAVAGLIAATWSIDTGQSIGGVGVAPEATLVPILLLGNGAQLIGDPVVAAFRYALQHGVDITNNSWGPNTDRTISTLSPDVYEILRRSVVEGRNGLGMINVFASGNNGGPGESADFPQFGNYDSATYNPFISSRYVISVGGIDHDGEYGNDGGLITSYPEAGADVLVAAPTGSNVGQDVANDDGTGSGLWTTDLVGKFGYNAAPNPVTGDDPDNDFLSNPDYTSRFNGTSGAAPLVSGVIALMLDANPNLTYRDVQEILVRSSRQAAQFDIPHTGGELEGTNTWQTNQFTMFREPDAWLGIGQTNPFEAQRNPLADATADDFPYSGPGTQFSSPGEGNDFSRQAGHYELQPAMWTNGAGYTVSQGYGAYSELIGYGHGVVDAGLAAQMAKDWHNLDQGISAGTERTFTTFVRNPGLNLPHAERASQDAGFLIVPGGIGGQGGFIGFWNEYFKPTINPPGPFDPANPAGWPRNTRGLSYLDFKVPVSEEINVEYVEVKLTITGAASGLDALRINLTSPSGTSSELNHFYLDPSIPIPRGFQDDPFSSPIAAIDPAGDINASDTFTWTFSTNRNWGESTNSQVIIDPLTGEPALGPDSLPMFRDWELHIENWDNSTDFGLAGVEIVWHGKEVEGGQLDQNWDDLGFQIPVAQRIQGVVAVDTNNDNEFSGIDPTIDNEFNNRYIQEFFGDPAAPRAADLTRRMLDDFDDNNFNGVYDDGDVRKQEPFAANALVQAFRFTVDGSGNDVVESQPIAQFLTGADGNYYFDLLPGNYMIRVTDRDNGYLPVEDTTTATTFLQHYKTEWRITPDWFFAADHDAITATGAQGEVFFDSSTKAPVPFQFLPGDPSIPMNVQNINFLLKQTDTPPNNVVITGSVIADLNADGNLDYFDAPAGNMRVYHDINRNGHMDSGEQFVTTASDGTYSITVPISDQSVVQLGVFLEPNWVPSLAGGDIKTVLVEPGNTLSNQNFFLNPPDDASGSGLSDITGFVFSDINSDGVKQVNEPGLGGIRVYIDANGNHSFDAATEIGVLTGSNGGFFIPDLAAGSYIVDVQIDNEGTAAALFQLTTQPGTGNQPVTLSAGQTKTIAPFGLHNLADRDWGDLPASFNVGGAPSHSVVSHFKLGNVVDGDLPNQAPGADDASDDGVIVLGDGVLHPTSNTLQVTVKGVGGILQGWIDWNNDGAFQASEHLVWRDGDTNALLGTDADLTPGTHKLKIDAPASIVAGALAARFRWGEVGLQLNEAAFIGEVEDYTLTSSAVIVAPTLPGDYNNDGAVNMSDYVLYRKLLSTGGSAPNTTNPAGPVTSADYPLWTTHYGNTAGGGGGGGSGEASAPASSAPESTSTTDLAPYSSSSGSTPATVTTVVDATASVNPPTSSTVAPSAGSASAVTNGYAFFAVSGVDIHSSVSFESSRDAAFTATVVNETEDSDLDTMLIYDQAWADTHDNAEVDSPLVDRQTEDTDDGYNDVALAAVFDDDANWWSL